MKVFSAVRTTAAAALLAVPAGYALASEAAVEGQGDLGGVEGLLMLVGGLVAMGFVIWIMLKVMNRK
jgi:uncharacterized membrane protein